MSQLSERMASAGGPMLEEMDGEPVMYTRYDSTQAVVTGFPKSITALFRVDNRARRMYDDGGGEIEIGIANFEVADIGSAPQIGNDKIVRADATTWIVEEIKENVAGRVACECAKYTAKWKGSKSGRLER